VYGANQVPMTEEMTPEPEDPYGVAKLAVEQDLKASHRMFGLDYTIFRPHNVYGERQNIGDRYRNVVGIFMNQLLQDQPMTVFGDGEQQRAFTHVDDVRPDRRVRGVGRGSQRDLQRGRGCALTVNELARIVARAMGRECRMRHLPAAMR